jgi:hypothetical protein
LQNARDAVKSLGMSVDYTLCHGDNCPKKLTCWRALKRPPSFFVSFFEKDPYDREAQSCEYFVEAKHPRKERGHHKQPTTEKPVRDYLGRPIKKIA